MAENTVYPTNIEAHAKDRNKHTAMYAEDRNISVQLIFVWKLSLTEKECGEIKS